MGYRVIVPPQEQQRVLKELHAGHPDVARMKGLARTIVWWLGLDGDIKRKVQGSSSCQMHHQKLHCIPGLGSISCG